MENVTQVAETKTLSKKNNYPVMATFLSRFLAYMVDSLLLSVISYVVFFLFIILGGIAGLGLGSAIVNPGDLENYQTKSFDNVWIGIVIAYVLGFIAIIGIQFFYFVYFTYKTGQTFGKKLLKIKVVNSTDLQELTLSRVFLREILGRWISGLAFNLGYFWYFMSGKRQTWHDNVSNTYVVALDQDGKIIMGGEQTYKQEPLKTFLPLVMVILCMILYFVMMIGLFFMLEADNQKSSSGKSRYEVINEIPSMQKYDDAELKSGEGGLCGGQTGIKCRPGLYCSFKDSPRIGVCAKIPN